MRLLLRVARVIPFAVFAGAGIWRAGQAPAGRRAPEFDWSVTAEAASRALTKVPHMRWMAVIFVLALLAVGLGRAAWAALLTIAVGLGWELAETTVVGHHAALVDMVPDVVTVVLAWAAAVGVRTVLSRRTREAVSTTGRSSGASR